MEEKPYWMREPKPKVMIRLQRIKEIIGNTERTVRNICYKLYPKLHGKALDRKYNTTIKDIVRARIRRIIDWDNIRESRVELHNGHGWENADRYVKFKTTDIWKYYSRNKRPSHRRYFECWFEKDTVMKEFRKICNKYDVPFMAIRGQLTWTMKRKSAIERLNDDDLILYFGDNDDKGKEIRDVIKRDLKYLGCNAEMRWVAITEEQEKKYSLPKNARIDGLDLKDLEELIEREVKKLIDIKKFNEIVEQEERDVEKLKKLKIIVE